MRRWKNRIFSLLVYALTAMTLLVLAFVIYFIVKEALPTFQEVWTALDADCLYRRSIVWDF